MMIKMIQPLPPQMAGASVVTHPEHIQHTVQPVRGAMSAKAAFSFCTLLSFLETLGNQEILFVKKTYDLVAYVFALHRYVWQTLLGASTGGGPTLICLSPPGWERGVLGTAPNKPKAPG